MRFRSNVETEEMVAPHVYAAFIPRNTIGEVEPGMITTYPAVVVRVKQGVQATEYERLTVELLIGVWDDSLDQQGSRDCLNLVTRIKNRLRESDIIRQRYPIRMPLNWQINKRAASGPTGDYNSYPYYFAEMQIDFEISTRANQFEATTMSTDSGQGMLETWRVPTEEYE